MVIFGRTERGELTLQEWADALGTIGEELVVRRRRRICRGSTGLIRDGSRLVQLWRSSTSRLVSSCQSVAIADSFSW